MPNTISARNCLDSNIVNFVRFVRRAGIHGGNAADAVEAVSQAGFGSRLHFRAALASALVKHAQDRVLFEAAFDMFWRVPKAEDWLRHLLSPQVGGSDPTQAPRLLEAWQEKSRSDRGGDGKSSDDSSARDESELDMVVDMSGSFSARELLASKDFEKMTASEVRAARRALLSLTLKADRMRTRRAEPWSHGHYDRRRTVRSALRSLDEGLRLHQCRARVRTRPIVVLCDISGSMGLYARLFLHFLHALCLSRKAVHGFVFGTRLTMITRHLARRDVDEALALAAHAAPDWDGGTRLGFALESFNRRWLRRLCVTPPHFWLMTDGLDRDGARGIAEHAAVLRRNVHELVWLNPLLRYDGYAPEATGAKALYPHCDRMAAVHSVSSVAALCESLCGAPGAGGHP